MVLVKYSYMARFICGQTTIIVFLQIALTRSKWEGSGQSRSQLLRRPMRVIHFHPLEILKVQNFLKQQVDCNINHDTVNFLSYNQCSVIKSDKQF